MGEEGENVVISLHLYLALFFSAEKLVLDPRSVARCNLTCKIKPLQFLPSIEVKKAPT